MIGLLHIENGRFSMEANAPYGERVLVVADEYLTRLALCDGLNHFGFHVIAARNAQQSHRRLPLKRTGLILNSPVREVRS